MKKSTLLLVVLCICISNTIFSQTYNLKWGASGWTGPQYAAALTNVGGSGVNINVGIVNSGGNVSAATTAANNAFQYNTPLVGAALVNWVLPGTTGNQPLAMIMDWNDLLQTVTTTITFSQPVKDVSFYLGDMDRTAPLTYVDRFIFTASKDGVPAPNPIVTKYQATTTGADTVLIAGNSAYGNSSTTNNYNAATNSLTTQGATIFVQYTTPITQIVLYWDQGPGATGNPAIQGVVIGDIQFTKATPPITPQVFPPIADNFTNTPMPQGNGATTIPGLTGADPDGRIVGYNITSIPPASEGILSVACPTTPVGATCTGGYAQLTAAVMAANPLGIGLDLGNAANLRFDPAPGFTGTSSFTFVSIDNHFNVSSPATYRQPVVAQPPVSNNLMENTMANTNGPTAIQGLSSADEDGTISTYQITTLPPTIQGVLSVPCPPTLAGATCTGGYQNLTAAILSSYAAGMPLTATQMAAMRFDPAAGFVGNAAFNYNAVDNSGNTSNTANYTIPVAATATIARPPLADNIKAQPLNNSLGNTAIPPLQASDLDGTVANYTIGTLPPPAQGVLRLSCPSTPAGLTCTGGFADILAGTVLTPAEAARLYFDPAPGFTGTASFIYTATDNTGLTSNTATYNLPVVNTPPVSTNKNASVPFNAGPTAIPALSGADADGTISAYNITSLPTAMQGVLSIPCPPTPAGATCTGGFADLTAAVLAANGGNIPLTPAQAAGIRFDPATGFSGTAPFTYTSVDNDGNVSAPANYDLRVALQPPVSTDVVRPSMPNTNGPTAITALNGTDADGTVVSYTILSTPDAAQGVLSIPCPATPTGATCTGGFANLTPAVLAANPNGIVLTPAQAAAMRFDPTANYTGLVSFKFSATDNSGLAGNVATYTQPVSGTGNIPPVASNIVSPAMANTNGPTAISPLIGTDADGTIASFTLQSIPDASQGVLSIPCPATPAGATCSGGFANLTAAVLAANPTGISLTPAQAAALRFDPAPGFAGNVSFAYTTVDNTGATSAGASYTIPVTSTPPIANAVVAPAMQQSNGPTTIPGLTATDVDGTIASYYIENLPPVTQGIISIPCPATPTGATCTGGYADLTAAVLANYPNGGIPLTPAQMAAMRFDPAPNHQGNVIFNYHAVDNSGLLSNNTTYTIPVSGLPPVSNNVVAPKMLNLNGPTAIPALNSTDADGTIVKYIINSIPPVSQGVLSIPCPAIPLGATCTGGFADLTAAVLAANPGGISISPAQAAAMRFDPDASYTGNVIFNYSAADNTGNLSNVATYTIPVGTAAALPLSLISFAAERNGDNILVKWKTENEINVSRYEVEYSTEGITYTKATILNAANMAVNNYQSVLLSFLQPVYYLRLKSIDDNGNFKYSQVITVLLNDKYKKAITVSPNPVTDKVTVKLTTDVAANSSLRIINMYGEVVLLQQQKLSKGDNLFYIQSLSNVANGVYTIQAVIGNETLVQKIIVNK